MVVTANRKASSLGKFRKPLKKINWALLTSIAVHGAFFALILPELNLNSQSENADISGETNVIELNALEQTRLPDFSGPQRFANFNNFNVPADMENGIDSIPIPNFDALPFSSYDNSFSSLPTPPPLPPISGSFDFSYGGSIVNIPAPRDLPVPPPISFNSNTLPSPPSFNDTPITNNNFDNLEGNVIDIVPQSPEQEAEIRRAIFQGRENDNIPSPRDVFNNRNSSNSPIVRNQNNDTPVNIISNNPNPNTNIENSTPRITSRDENVSDEEARKNYIAWLQDVNNPTPQEITMAGYYPAEACSGNIEGIVTYGINVNGDGTVVDHQLIKSSGYPLLNNQALEQIQARAFDNATGGNKPYHVYVEFKPSNDVCGSTTVNTNQQNNTPTSPPSGTNNPRPEVNSSGVTPRQININTPANPPESPESVREILSNSQSQNNSSNADEESSDDRETNGASSLGQEPIIPENTELEVEFVN